MGLHHRHGIFVLGIWALFAQGAEIPWELGVRVGPANVLRHSFSVPTSGTDISLKSPYNDSQYSVQLSGNVELGEKHGISFLLSPLTRVIQFQTTAPIVFGDLTVPTSNSIRIGSRLDLYRLSYYYKLIWESCVFHVGGSLNVLDREKSLSSSLGVRVEDQASLMPALHVSGLLPIWGKLHLELGSDNWIASGTELHDLNASLQHRNDGLVFSFNYRIFSGSAGTDSFRYDVFYFGLSVSP